LARTKSYEHFCVVARSLEVIGDKWSLLVVRDLLRGPQRFSDLLRFMGGITPKWLSARLKELEQAGIVERDSLQGRREVWYTLTPKGEALGPVVSALAVWGVEHASRAPRPGEPIFPEVVLQGASTYMNHRAVRAERPVRWQFYFDTARPAALVYDGDRWSSQPGEAASPDLVIATTPEDLLTYLNTPPRERSTTLQLLRVEGSDDAVALFKRTMVRGPATSPSRSPAPSAKA
jgi:DNA-binding HxlR family transcriptional regulator